MIIFRFEMLGADRKSVGDTLYVLADCEESAMARLRKHIDGRGEIYAMVRVANAGQVLLAGEGGSK